MDGLTQACRANPKHEVRRTEQPCQAVSADRLARAKRSAWILAKPYCKSMAWPKPFPLWR